ncbi:MAG: pyridoxamine 5'-phosphate oxidase family protein [Opitutaceae bacterium]|nr:pyridoxamine 5'-phosphate oxidase family protein [Cytophagales bacterium]
MDSINKQQEENNYKDLEGEEILEKINEANEKSKSCFFCTSIRTGEKFATRPMSVQKIDEKGNLWFLSSIDSHKNQQIALDPTVQLLFKGSDYSDFLTLYGNASISTDKDIIKELWNPILKTWFTDGIEDKRISVIKVTPIDGYYWDTKHGETVAFAKQMVGAMLGKTLDDSIEGRLKL